MTWFKVDDNFHSHPKALAAGPAAIGLWTIAGSWSAAHLTEGHIKTHVLLTLTSDRARSRLAKRLVDAQLWDRVADGYQFRNWHKYQPTKEAVEQERQANRARQARFREAKRNAVTNASVTPSVTPVVTGPRPDPSFIGVDVVTDPVRGRHSRSVENPSRFPNSNPQDGAAGRLPSARPLAAANEHAGINGTPLRGNPVRDIAAKARKAIEEAGSG